MNPLLQYIMQMIQQQGQGQQDSSMGSILGGGQQQSPMGMNPMQGYLQAMQSPQQAQSPMGGQGWSLSSLMGAPQPGQNNNFQSMLGGQGTAGPAAGAGFQSQLQGAGTGVPTPGMSFQQMMQPGASPAGGGMQSQLQAPPQMGGSARSGGIMDYLQAMRGGG